MRIRLLRFVLIAAATLAIPGAVALATGPKDHGKSQADAHAKVHNGDTGKPDGAGAPETAGERRHNHGWYVSQVARDHSTTGRAHGEAVSAVAQGDDGKADSAP